MGYVSVRSAPPYAVVEVDGTLDLARVHDLGRAVARAAHEGCRQVDVDLSRVDAIGPEADEAVVVCLEQLTAVVASVRISVLSPAAALSLGLVSLARAQQEQPRSA